MKVVALIPYWSKHSFQEKSIDNIDIIKLGGKPLINYTVDLALKIEEIDDIVVYTSSANMSNFINNSDKCIFINRSKELDTKDTTIEDIIESFLMDNDADIIVLMHPRNPFLSKKTLHSCIDAVRNRKYNSSCVVTKANKLSWFNGKPLNYKFGERIPNHSLVDPVILELSSIYVFTKELFKEKHSRIDNNVFMVEVGHFEGFEIDKEEDYQIAELIVNSGLEFIRE
jgi:CMP-N-acetylneuraminic acid synthetase